MWGGSGGKERCNRYFRGKKFAGGGGGAPVSLIEEDSGSGHFFFVGSFSQNSEGTNGGFRSGSI